MDQIKAAALEALCCPIDCCVVDIASSHIQFLLKRRYLQNGRKDGISFTYLGQSAAKEIDEVSKTGADIGLLVETIYSLANAELMDGAASRQERKRAGSKAKIPEHSSKREEAAEKADKQAYAILHAYDYLKDNTPYVISPRGWPLFRSVEKLMK